MASKLYVPALGGLYAKLDPYSWPLVRFIAGAMLVPHGYSKVFGGGMEGIIGFVGSLGFQPAFLWGWLVALLEFFGGILLAVGFLTRVVAAMLAIQMAVVVIMVHGANGYFWNNGGYEYPLMWGLLALAIVFRGAGDYSVDKQLGREF